MLCNKILAIPLEILLGNVFYGRKCHGAYFKINKITNDINKDFEECIDRQYMSMVHGSQFIGNVGVCQKIHYDIFSRTDDYHANDYGYDCKNEILNQVS